jgi:two-component system response regulator HydG
MHKYPLLPILMVDDEDDVLHSYKMTLQLNGINNFVLCNDSREVIPMLEKTRISIVLLDLFMPHTSGMEILSKLNEHYPDVPVIVITGSNKVETAVQCMKSGALDYMVKPVEENRLCSGVRNALHIYEMQNELHALSRQIVSGGTLRYPDDFAKIVTISNTMHAIFKYIEAIAGSPRPVLITGESGVGKELIAEAIHKASKRTGKFVTVNVGGLDDTVFSDTLFGHKKGAFTGAETARPGLIERAGGGTLFLDEIGDLENSTQIKLLRLLQQNEYYQLGSDVCTITDARIIAATNVDIEEKLKRGLFRKDLYYRLMTHHIHIPPLRERLEDLPVLFEFFLEEAAVSLGKKKPTVPRELPTLLSTYQFPGNIRELQSITFDAVSRNESKMLGYSFFKEYIDKIKEMDIGTVGEPQTQEGEIYYAGEFPTLKKVEEFFIAEAMEKAKGNQSIAAQLLGVSPSTLSRRFKDKADN